MSFHNIYDGLKVMVTGHTGFKGSWLSIWLKELNATVIGYSLEAPTQPNLFESCGLEGQVTHIHGDIRDYADLYKAIQTYRPQLIFHLAAQPLVLASYKSPRETFETNVQGSVNVLEATRLCDSVKAVVMITTDKVYENKGWLWGYRENDALGSADPYSTSKAMAEMAIESYRRSFFEGDQNFKAIASARSGNVIGGGDFSPNRLLPDIIDALKNNTPIPVRNPSSVRPWMHVLDPLSGYLWLGTQLLRNPTYHSEAWNFGPREQQCVTCKAIVEKAVDVWGKGSWYHSEDPSALPEMQLLQLESSKALKKLGWQPSYGWNKAIEETVVWYKQFQECNDPQHIYSLCRTQIKKYVETATDLQVDWAPQYSMVN